MVMRPITTVAARESKRLFEGKSRGAFFVYAIFTSDRKYRVVDSKFLRDRHSFVTLDA